MSDASAQDVDDYYASILAYVVVHETPAGSVIQSIRDLSGRWGRSLSTGGVGIPGPDKTAVHLPRAIARLRR